MRDRESERWLEHAQRQLAQGHTDGAIESLRRVLTVDPDQAEAHALLGLCLLDKRRARAAELEVGLALTLEPELSLAHFARAHVLIAQRRFGEAEAHLRQLLADEPHSALYHRALARLYSLHGDARQVLPLLERALELEPEDVGTRVALSEYHRERGDFAAAGAQALAALELEPEHAGALVAMGHVLLRRGDSADAREHALAALRSDPTDIRALHLLAAVKAHRSWLLGLWWRYNVWMEAIGSTRSILVLLGAFVLYRVAVLVAGDFSRPDLAAGISIGWLAVVVYTWAGPALFQRSLKKELADIRLSKGF